MVSFPLSLPPFSLLHPLPLYTLLADYTLTSQTLLKHGLLPSILVTMLKIMASHQEDEDDDDDDLQEDSRESQSPTSLAAQVRTCIVGLSFISLFLKGSLPLSFSTSDSLSFPYSPSPFPPFIFVSSLCPHPHSLPPSILPTLSSLRPSLNSLVSSPDPTLCEERGLVTMGRFLGCAHH